jgi:hypothetical protein
MCIACACIWVVPNYPQEFETAGVLILSQLAHAVCTRIFCLCECIVHLVIYTLIEHTPIFKCICTLKRQHVRSAIWIGVYWCTRAHVPVCLCAHEHTAMHANHGFHIDMNALKLSAYVYMLFPTEEHHGSAR